MPKRVIVTADDLGLTTEVTDGILTAARDGVVSAASLLMNGLATDYAIERAQDVPELEIGIHLSIVEGLSLVGHASSVTDPVRYFEDRLCLHRHWPPFLRKLASGAIRLGELELECEKQLDAFGKRFGSIPFLNSTQHLHLLPGVSDVVLRLMSKYEIRCLRLPSYELQRVNRRVLSHLAMFMLGRRVRRRASRAGILAADQFHGFARAGSVDAAYIRQTLARIGENQTAEIMVHPGLDCPYLRKTLPDNYREFDWTGDLQACTDPAVKTDLKAMKIDLVNFSSLRSRSNA